MTRVFLPCDGLDCDCANHVDTDTHVPVCPIHGDPLVASERPGVGQCRRSTTVRSDVSRFPRLVVCGSWGPQSWVWKRRDGFHGDDLPPANGWKPIDLSAAGVVQ